MKHAAILRLREVGFPFSALGRAVWDETGTLLHMYLSRRRFQCSRSSRMG